jgi:hypothetical protein
MGDAEVEDQTPAPGLISKIVADLDVAPPLAHDKFEKLHPPNFTTQIPHAR